MSDQWGGAAPEPPGDGSSGGWEPPGRPPTGGVPPGRPPTEPPTVGVPPQSYPPGGAPQQSPNPTPPAQPHYGYVPQHQPHDQVYGQAQYGQQPYYAGGYPQPSSDAKTAIGLSAAGLTVLAVLGLCFGPFALIGTVLSGLGTYKGTQEIRAIDAGRSSPAGRSMAKAAQILGVIGVVVGAIGLMITVAFVLILVAAG
ncbi:MAG: hypothetical protein AAGD35_05240 [Actinomycetota bacterium]